MLLLKNVNIVNTKKGVLKNFNIAIKGSVIIDIFPADVEKREYNDFETIHCNGLLASPSFVDLHTHLREPGFEYKETILTGADAAKAGGFTDICCMANTSPVIDSESVIKFIKERAAETDINIYPIAAITKGLEGKTLTEFGHLIESGAIAFSDDGADVDNPFLLKTAFEYASFFNVPIFCHCEETLLASNGCMNEGYFSTVSGLHGIPAIAEDINVFRNIRIAEYVNANIHICHVSTKGSVEIIKQAIERGVNVTSETCPHYLSLTDEDVYKSGYNTYFKMNPPLRGRNDREALIEAIRDDIITSIATDHAPHAEHEKAVEFEYAPFGIIGLETAFTVCYQLVLQGKITLEKLIEKMSLEPARIINLKKSELEINSLANITLINLNLEKKFDKEQINSKSTNSPFIGKTFKGWPVMTISKGKVVYNSKGV